jgi:long-subunit fatty acid transport protein
MKRHCLSICFLTLLITNPGHAQNFYGAGTSADTARRAGIYAASTDNPADALSMNPAGLTALTAPTVNLSVAGIFARGSFSNASNKASPMSSNDGIVPFGAFGSPLGKHWAFGVGLMPDFLSASKWSYSDTSGLAGTTYGPQNEKSQIVALRGSAGIAYRFSSKVSAGATFGIDANANTLITPYIFQSNPALAGLKTLLNLHTAGYGWNSSVGLIAKPSKKLQLAASFRTSTSITSHGTATGNMGAEFQSLGLAFQPDFGYHAQVHVELPPSAIFSAGLQVTPSYRLSLQTDWIGWRNAFNSLPVTLTDGTNRDINALLQSSTLKDTVPLEWKNQVIVRGAIERTLGEGVTIGAGYLYNNSPVPDSTLSPLTAAIMKNGITTGIGWHTGRVHFGIAYGFDFTAHQQVTNSALLYDEYSNSKTQIGTQALTFSTAFTL